MVNRFITLLRKTSHNASLQQGQVLLIVVLVMVVALTVGLSVATRSITNLRTTTEEENSQRAFSAAEAGVERAIQSQGSLTDATTLDNNAKIKNVVYAPLSVDTNNRIALNNSGSIAQNFGTDIWFTPRNLDGTIDTANPWSGNLTIYWGNDTNECSSALEVIFLSISGGQMITTHQLIDRCTVASRNTSNGSTNGAIGVAPASVTQVISGKTYYNVKNFGSLSNLIHARVVPLYGATRIAVEAAGLPSQGQKITSTGESGETFRKIEVTRPYPGIPVELFSVLFSPAGNP